MRFSSRYWFAALALAIAAVVTAGAVVAPRPVAAASPPLTATDGPGATSHYDLARQDCVGTARNSTSQVLYTVAGGVLTDVRYPTLDNTDVESLQYVVTDGTTFTDLQARDMTYTVSTPDPSGMVCEVTSTANSGKYQLVTDYITDPATNSVVMRTHLVALAGSSSDYHVYVRFDGTINGNGGGGSTSTTNGGDTSTVDQATTALVSSDPVTVTSTSQVTSYRVPVYAALLANQPFTASESGYVGAASDGLTQLDASHSLTTLTTDATYGNTVQTGAIAGDPGTPFTLALSFGQTMAGAIGAAQAATTTPYGSIYSSFTAGWAAYDAGLNAPPASYPGLTPAQAAQVNAKYFPALNTIKASEDKVFPGAIVAALSTPWAQSTVANSTSGGRPGFPTGPAGSYRFVFSRDLYETVTALLAAGDLATAQAATKYLFLVQEQASGLIPRATYLNGQAQSTGVQLDQQTYPLLLAYETGLANDNTIYPALIRAANYAVARGPSNGNERWEEQSGNSPSTTAAEIAGLTAAASIADTHGDHALAQVYRNTADNFLSTIKGLTVTTNGPYGAGRYFIRVNKSTPNTATTYGLGNGGPTVDQRSVVDAGFLELVRLGELPATDSDVTTSLGIVDQVIKVVTNNGPGWYRYGTSTAGSEDGYGDCYQPDSTSCTATGRPYASVGSGHLWPNLAGERAEYDMLAGDSTTAASLLYTLYSQSSTAPGVGFFPEQVWENADFPADPYATRVGSPGTASIGYTNGLTTGSPNPLTWTTAQYVRLILDLGANQVQDRPALVRDRYVTNGPPASIAVTIAAPAGTSTTTSPTTVSGTTTPGANVVILSTSTSISTDDRSSRAQTTAAADGTYSAAVETPNNGGTGNGTDIITVTATTADGATGYARKSITSSAPNAATTTAVTDTVDPSILGDPVTFTATVNAAGTPAHPTGGSVQFTLDGSNVGQPVAIDANGQATWTTSTLSLGLHSVTAVFGAYGHFPASTSPAQTHLVEIPFPLVAYTLDPATPSGQNGWYSGDVSLAWQVSGADSTVGCVNTTYTTDGVFSSSCSATNTSGTTGPMTATVRRDATPPVTTPAVLPATPDGKNGWYVTNPLLSLTAVDATSGVASTQYSIGVNGASTPYLGPFLFCSAANPCGRHWWHFSSTDVAGNVEPAGSLTLSVDLNDPTSSAAISPAPQNGWYASPTVTLTGDDGPTGSGIDHISYSLDGGPWTTYAGPLSGFSTGNHFIQYRATDVAGLVEPTTNLIAFKADAVKPSVTITAPPDGATYPLHKPQAAKFKCTDAQSGLASCVGTVANGADIDTAAIGAHTFTVTATDLAGNVTTATSRYTVVYTWNGFFSPISNSADTQLNLVHAGDLIKVGFGLNGDQGLDVLAAGSPASVSIACPAWTPHLVPAAGSGSTPGLSFGVASGHYTFGWQTQSGWAGTCRRFELQTKDGTAPHTADFMFFS